MKKEEFLRRVFSVNTEAGSAIKYIITKATCSPNYAKLITFNNSITYINRSAEVLARLFIWRTTPEGWAYWDSICKDLMFVDNIIQLKGK